MALEGMVHSQLWKEVPEEDHGRIREAMKRLIETGKPGRDRNVSPLAGSRYPRSYRLRVGRYRVCLIHFPDEDVVVFTTGFLKRRPSDYQDALDRHDRRVRDYE